jgi:hypothetical protein
MLWATGEGPLQGLSRDVRDLRKSKPQPDLRKLDAPSCRRYVQRRTRFYCWVASAEESRSQTADFFNSLKGKIRFP